MHSNMSWAFVCTNRLLHLLELLSNYVRSNENESFSLLNVHAIFYLHSATNKFQDWPWKTSLKQDIWIFFDFFIQNILLQFQYTCLQRFNSDSNACFAEINNFQFVFFLISEQTQIILSKSTYKYIDIIIIYVSIMPCFQIQC